jgi:hyperosmotically inducible protein
VKRTLALLALLALGACTSKQVDDAAKSVETAAPALLSDAAATAQIEAHFISIDSDSALHVAVAVHDGVVTLSGRAKSAAVADRFVAAAKAVNGVKSVASTIAVDANLPHATDQAKDAFTTAAVTTAIAGQAGINALGIKVAAHAGAVTLSGSVRSEALKTTVADAAKHASGVRSVDDQLTVKP